MTYKAAEIDYRYLHWDDARPRMEQIVAKYCKDDIGANAGNAILVSYTIEKNLDKIEEWANRLQAANCGSTLTAQKNAAELGKLSLGVKFQKADALFAEKKYEEAAEALRRDRRPRSARRGRRQGAQQRRRRLRERQALRRGDQAVRAHRQRVPDLEVRRRRAVPHRGQLPEGVRVRHGGRPLPAARRGQALRGLGAPHRRALQRRHHPRERSELRQGGRPVQALRGRQVDQARGCRPRPSSAPASTSRS